jgi:uncharacterized protein with HEPN domain
VTPEERKELHWLRDMRAAIGKIEEHPKFAEGQTAFDADEHFRIWVLFHLERIGECASRLRREHDYDAKHPEIDWQGTQAMRRKIVHTYWDTDYGKVWQGVEYLPKITEKLDDLLKVKDQELADDSAKSGDAIQLDDSGKQEELPLPDGPPRP